MFRFCHAFLSVHCSLVVTCWERAIIFVLLCVIYCVFLSLSHVVSYLIVLIPDLCFLTYFCHDKILLKPWIYFWQRITHDKHWVTLSTTCLGELPRCLMSLNCSPEKGWLHGFRRFFDSFFMSLWEQITHRCSGGKFEPKGYRLQRVRWFNIVNHYALLHTKYKSYLLHGFRRFFNVFPHYKEANNRQTLMAWPSRTPRARLARFMQGTTRHCYILKCKLCAHRKDFLKFFFPL